MEEIYRIDKDGEILISKDGILAFFNSIKSDYPLEKISDVDRAILHISGWLKMGCGVMESATTLIEESERNKSRVANDIYDVIYSMGESSNGVYDIANKVSTWLKENHNPTLWGLFSNIQSRSENLLKAVESFWNIRIHDRERILALHLNTWAVYNKVESCRPYYTDCPVPTTPAQGEPAKAKGEPAKAKGEHQRKVNNREAFEKITGSQSYKAIMAGLVSDGKLSRAHDGKYNYNDDEAEYRADHVRALIKILYDKFGKTPCFDIWDSVFSKKSFAHGNIREGVTTNVNKDIEAYWKKTDNGKIL